VRAFDPLAEPNAEPLVGAEALCDELLDPLRDAEALLVLTDCREFAQPDFAAMHDTMRLPLIVDGRGVLDAEAARAAGFVYLGVSDTGTDAMESARTAGAVEAGDA
jgi:UDPglucose 6-dehydrogenase